MSDLLQMVATSRAVISQALRALGSAPLSRRIFAVDKFPPAALNISGVIPGGDIKHPFLTLYIHNTSLSGCAHV